MVGLPCTAQLASLVGGMEGRREEALATLARVDVAPLDSHHTFHLAESFAMAGDTDRALELLDRAVDGGFHPAPFIAEYCPFMAPLRGTPAFARVVARASARVAAFAA